MARRSRLLPYLVAFVAVIAALAAFMEFAFLREQNGLKQTLSFKGLTRDEAYGRLRSYGLTARGWPDLADQQLVSTAPWPPLDAWPQTGDVEIDFSRVHEAAPDGTCGASARIVLRFSDDRVAKVERGKTLDACL